MASTKTFISVGVLLLTIVIGSYVMITMDNTLRIKVEATQSTFQSYIDGSWQTAGVEKNALYNGSKSVIRNASLGNISYLIEQTNNKTTIIRKNTYNYLSKPTITDIYQFDGGTNAVELFPVSHKIIIENATGLIYQYQVTKLEYKGVTLKDVTSPQSFGKNMKVEWEPGYYYSQIFKYAGVNEGKLTVKYKINSSYEEYDVRLFDPPLPNKTIINPEYLAGNLEYDQLYISSTGVINVNASVGYLNITANNITILGKIYANELGFTPGSTNKVCGGGTVTGTVGNGPGGGSIVGTGYAYPACGYGGSTATAGSGATTSYMGTNNFTMIFGSAGAGGGIGKDMYCSSSCPSENIWNAAGGKGGGWIALNSPTLTISGELYAKGQNGANGPCNTYYCKSGGGGGGSGGQILLQGTNINLNNGKFDVSGGSGGSGTAVGGTGQGGRVKVRYGLTYTTSGTIFTLGTSGINYVELTGLSIVQNLPTSEYYTNQSNVTFNCSFVSNSDPYFNIGLNIYEQNGNLFKQILNNTDGFSNKTHFTFNWSNITFYQNQSGVLNWSCSGYAKPYDINSTGGTSGTLVNFNYTQDNQQGVELTKRILYIDNYNMSVNYSNSNLANGSWSNISNQIFSIDITGVPIYTNLYNLTNSTGVYMINSTSASSLSYTNLPDGYYNLTNNITSCPLCTYGASGSARTYSNVLSTLFNIDTIIPIVNWTQDTTLLNRTANFSKQNWIYGKINVYELNLKNITFRVRNSTGYVNVTTYTF